MTLSDRFFSVAADVRVRTKQRVLRASVGFVEPALQDQPTCKETLARPRRKVLTSRGKINQTVSKFPSSYSSSSYTSFSTGEMFCSPFR